MKFWRHFERFEALKVPDPMYANGWPQVPLNKYAMAELITILLYDLVIPVWR